MSEVKQLWIMGTCTGPLPDQWSIGGVFDSKEKALDACKNHLDFIGPLDLNVKLPVEDTEWVGGYYPLAK